MPIDFDQFIAQLTRRLKSPLPGPIAHEPLRAVPIGTLKPTFDHSLPPRPGSVLILLYPDGDEIKFPLTQRPEYVGAHSGQVSLPGGKAEVGETVEQTALREGEEEIGIRASDVTIIGRLSEFFVIPSNFVVTPVIGFLPVKPTLTPDPVEVVRILEGNLNDLVREGAVLTREIVAAKTYRLSAPHFLIENEVVWGATAMMLNEFRTLLKDLA